MKKFLAALGIAIAIIVIVAVVRMFTLTPRKAVAVSSDQRISIAVDAETTAANLSQALTYRTISFQDSTRFAPEPFRAFNRFLKNTYPAVHRTLKREVVNDYSLLYTWEGSEPDLKPIILMAHSDVVPVDQATVKDWTQPPFSGAIEDGFIWGRGAMDDKASLVGLMEAVEYLINEDFTPRRTILLTFGHDEEIGGQGGAARIAGLLQSRGVQAEYILDEGMVITYGITPGVETPVAMIGIAEKGYMSVKLSVETSGGHSSMPPPSTGVGILCRAVARLEENQRPATIQGVAQQLFEALGPEMPFFQRMTFANLWLLSPVIKSQLAATPATNAMIRTTTAATMAAGSPKENILPSHASIVVNFRIIPGETSEIVLEHIQQTIDDPRVEIEVLGLLYEPSVVSDTETPSYKTLERTIRELFPEVIVAPSLVLGATDSRHYQDLSPNTYRFIPYRITSEDLERIHGTNERMGVDNLVDIVRFYARLVVNTAS